MTFERQLERILPQVEKPGRYIGGELHSVIKDCNNINTRIGFAFPDTYEIGMSYPGLQILYKVLNNLEGVYCERLFAPAIDMENRMRECGIPLFTLETKLPAKELDMLGFTLQYELSYTNILNMLDLAGIPLRRDERDETHPFIIGGGPCAFNPEPVADFFDFFVIGDGEEILKDICERHSRWKEGKGNRNDFMLTVSGLPGIYVPSFYKPIYETDGRLNSIVKTEPEAPDTIRKQIVSNLNQAYYPTEPIVPFIETVHDRSVLELFRGCTRGCRFCQAGMIYRPVRERSSDCALELIEKQLASTGYDELSLLSLSTSDYSEFEHLAGRLIETGKRKNVAVSLPSLRLDSLSFEILGQIQEYKKTGLTFAPEAGTQRLRDVINKNITDDDIYESMKQAIRLGWNSVKLYFMIGLPTETFEDLDGIATIASNIMEIYYEHIGRRKGGKFNITVSGSNFVPKPHTPFQWAEQDSPELFREKHYYLKDKFKKIRGAQFSYHDTGASRMEAVLARGDRRLSDVVLKAWESGCKFDGWREHFNYEKWLNALDSASIDPDFYTSGRVSGSRVLPWGLIDSGVEEAYLQKEWDKAKNTELTPDCRTGCTGCGVNRFTACEREGTI
ncbi:TIGR03960 family B12-binding radical SAM protein [Bacillota bacterium]